MQLNMAIPRAPSAIILTDQSRDGGRRAWPYFSDFPEDRGTELELIWIWV